MIISTSFSGTAEISTSLIPQRYRTSGGDVYITSLGNTYLTKAGSVSPSIIKIGDGSASSDFDDFFQCTGGGVAALIIESDRPFTSVNFAASSDLLIESANGSVQLIDGVGVLNLTAQGPQKYLTVNNNYYLTSLGEYYITSASKGVSSVNVKITGMNTGDRIYISRPAIAIEYPYSPQSGMLLTRYSTSRVEYTGVNSIYPANNIYQQSSLPVTLKIPNIIRADAESISEYFDDAQGACIIDTMYMFNLDWNMKANASTRALVDGSIIGRVFKPND